MDERKDESNQSDSIESQILAFAESIGEETKDNFKVFLYRYGKDEESGRFKKKFLASLNSKEPDINEIATKYRGGSYLISFNYKKGKEPKSKSFIIDIDEEAFPIIPKNQNQLSFPTMPSGSLSEPMQLQFMLLQSTAEILKEAYKGGNQNFTQNTKFDPMEQFSGVMETMESTMQRTLAIQQNIMEKVFRKSMETRYGLLEEKETVQQTENSENQNSIIGQYTPIIREIVDGLKTVFNFFGDKLPETVVKQVKSDERFQSIVKNPQALVVIGQALRKEFGDIKAGEIMKSFGVKMVIKNPVEVRKTPDIPMVSKSLPIVTEKNTLNNSPLNNKQPQKAKETAKKG